MPQEREIALLFTLHPHPHARFLVALLDQLVVDRAGERCMTERRKSVYGLF